MIDKLLSQDNYANDAFLARGLNPSDAETIRELEAVTNIFLSTLKSGLQVSDDLKGFVSDLVDMLPWDDFDTEEKEFLADVLAPAIESVGLDPWKIF